MARKMRKFSEGGAQGRYDRRMADIEKDFKKGSAGKTGKALEVLEAKRMQRTADAKDDLAKRTGADRTSTRAAERAAEETLTKTRRQGKSLLGTESFMKSSEFASKAAAEKAPTTAAAPAPETAKAKPKSRREEFNEAFRAARKDPEAMKRGVFTFNGEKFSTKMAGEGRRATPPAAAKNNPPAAAKNNPPAAAAPPAAAKNNPPASAAPPAAAKNNPPASAAKNPPAAAAKRYETPAEARARVAKLTGSAKRRENFADMIGIGSVDSARANARLLATRAAEKARNEARRKNLTPLASGSDTRAFFTYGKAAAEKNAAKAKGGTVRKETTMNKKPVPANKKPMPKEPITGGANTVPLTPERKEFLKELAKRNAKPGMAKGGKVAPKFGKALVKKSADTMGRAMVKKAGGGKCYASGGSVSSASKRADGCAVKGKTKGKMLARGGAAQMRSRDSYGGANFKKGGSC
jgi:hypothetical protein